MRSGFDRCVRFVNAARLDRRIQIGVGGWPTLGVESFICPALRNEVVAFFEEVARQRSLDPRHGADDNLLSVTVNAT